MPETKKGMKGTLNQLPLVDTSKEHLVPLPTPININKLDEVLGQHADRVFVAKLCSYLRTGVDIDCNCPRFARFSKNLPTAFEHSPKLLPKI